MPTAKTVVLKEPRPVRGTSRDTRARLMRAAARIFNRDGYGGTDSNRIAREAGYAPGTFYKHFKDKTAIFLAVYDEIIDGEWREIERALKEAGSADARARRVVELVLRHHTEWRILRRSLRMLVALEGAVRTHFWTHRGQALELIARFRRELGTVERTVEEDAILVFKMERLCDAIAEDETGTLGLSNDNILGNLRTHVRAHLERAPEATPRRKKRAR